MAHPKEEVWALVIDSGCGTVPRVFVSQEAAKAALTDYVRDRWDVMGDHHDCPPETFASLTDDEAVAVYFEGAGCDDWYVLEPVSLEG